MLLPINLNDLLSARTVESNRIEFKEGWNPDAIYKTICAFANDSDNGGGGYIVVGVAEERGRAKRPVLGLTTNELARIQREMIGYNNLIRPVYHPRLLHGFTAACRTVITLIIVEWRKISVVLATGRVGIRLMPSPHAIDSWLICPNGSTAVASISRSQAGVESGSPAITSPPLSHVLTG